MAEPYTKLSHAPPEVADPEAPERVQIFVARYRYFFLLLAVLVAQLPAAILSRSLEARARC